MYLFKYIILLLLILITTFACFFSLALIPILEEGVKKNTFYALFLPGDLKKFPIPPKVGDEDVTMFYQMFEVISFSQRTINYSTSMKQVEIIDFYNKKFKLKSCENKIDPYNNKYTQCSYSGDYQYEFFIKKNGDLINLQISWGE
ncbi:hypothetical protein [Bartonella sp. HY038]|uniref:hypothetical protein n=1 Tax=Bartonella sp. HY038 TaxID=2759660 RepID=UPI0015F7FB7E|nr:hypothetical protein [Bartonella sp. HY038]